MYCTLQGVTLDTTNRPDCQFPELSPHTAYGYGCRCTVCHEVKKAGRRRTNHTLRRKAYDTMRNRARRGSKYIMQLPSKPEELLELFSVYLKRQILWDSGVFCHVDHIVPVSQGGTHTPDNVRILSDVENMRRYYRPEMECTPLDLVDLEQWITYNEVMEQARDYFKIPEPKLLLPRKNSGKPQTEKKLV